MSYDAATFLAQLFAPAPLIDQKAEILAELGRANTYAPVVACEPVREQPASNPRLTRGVRRFEVCRRLIGNGLAPIMPTIPPTAILATPAVLCPCCQTTPVLPELRGLTGRRCYGCWLKTDPPAACGEARRTLFDPTVDQAVHLPERS